MYDPSTEEEENCERIQLLDLARGRLVDNYSTENLQGENSTKWQDFPSVELDLILVATNHFSEAKKAWRRWIRSSLQGTLLLNPMIMSNLNLQGVVMFKETKS